MKKYRILKKLDLANQVKYYPQQKKWLMWMPFIKTEPFPVEICYDSYEAALRFIDLRKNQPNPEIYYV